MLIIAAAIRGMGESALDTFLPVYFLENWKYSINRIAIYKSLMRASGTITHPLLGIIVDKSFGNNPPNLLRGQVKNRWESVHKDPMQNILEPFNRLGEDTYLATMDVDSECK